MRSVRAFARDDHVLRRALDAHALRLQAIAHNVANANTPGFKRLVVQFEGELQRELGLDTAGKSRLPLTVTHPRHLRPGSAGSGRTARPIVHEDSRTAMRNDGNNVDPDREMVELARTQLSFQALSRLVADRYRRVRTVVQQGGR